MNNDLQHNKIETSYKFDQMVKVQDCKELN